jgi:hypothetical protein
VTDLWDTTTFRALMRRDAKVREMCPRVVPPMLT